MTEQEITAIAERAQKATPGEWRISHEYTEDGAMEQYPWALVGPLNVTVQPGTEYAERYGQQVSEISELGDDDARFIAHARQDIPDLLAALKEAEQERDYYKALWDANAARLVDANLYVSTYLPEQAGRPIWHVILDDAIRLREQSQALLKALKDISAHVECGPSSACYSSGRRARQALDTYLTEGR